MIHEIHPIRSLEELQIENPASPVIHTLQFEEDLKKYVGGDYCITTDSASNAILLLINLYRSYFASNERRVQLPKNTYISVLNQLHLGGYEVDLVDKEWSKFYGIDFGPLAVCNSTEDNRDYVHDLGFNSGNFSIIDSAGTLIKNQCRSYEMLQNIYDKDQNLFTVFSFHQAKPLSLGVGGAIVFNKFNENAEDIYNLLKRMAHDGRDASLPVGEDKILKADLWDNFEPVPFGFHCPMQPQTAAMASVKLKEYQLSIKQGKSYKFPTSTDYPDLSML